MQTPLNTPHKQKKHTENNQAFFQQLSEFTPAMLYVQDLEEREIIFINKSVENFLGHTAEYIYQKGHAIFKEVIHPDDYEGFMTHLETCKSLATDEVKLIDTRLKAASGDWRWFRLQDKAFKRDDQGEVVQTVGTIQDIHEEKTAVEKLQEEHRRLANAQALGQLGSIERPLPGDLLYCSDEFFRIHGLKPQSQGISMTKFISLVHPEDQEPFRAAIQHMHATGESLNITHRIVHTDGSIRHVHRRANVFFNAQKEPIRTYGTIQDITEQVLAQKKIEENEVLLRQAEHVARTGSYEIDAATHCIRFSEGLYNIFGYKPGAVAPSLNWIDSISHPDDVVISRSKIALAALDKKPYTYTRRFTRKDGEQRIVEVHGKVVCDAEGKADKYIGLAQDITERKQAEEELRKSEERSRNLLNVLQNAPDAFLVLTPDLIIEIASDAYLAATFTKREHLIGQYMFDVFPDNPAIADATGVRNLAASFKKVLTDRKPHRMAIQHYDVPRPGGGFEEKYWSPINTPVLNAAGEVEYIIYRVVDVTEVMKEQTAEEGLASEAEILKTSLEEIKLQAAQLKESRALLQSIFDASPNSKVVLKALYTPEGEVEDFEFVKANEFTIKTIGGIDIIGKRYSLLFPTVKENGILEKFKAVVKSGNTITFDQWYEGEGMHHHFQFTANLG